jgi:hypothetical protein
MPSDTVTWFLALPADQRSSRRSGKPPGDDGLSAFIGGWASRKTYVPPRSNAGIAQAVLV